MNLDIQFKIKSDSNYGRYLRENSNWYKILNRNPERFDDFVNEMKENYKLRPVDRINSVSEKLDLVSTFLSILR